MAHPKARSRGTEATNVPGAWWGKLADHVRAGGGLAVVPGGEEVVAGLEAFNRQGLAAGLLPASLDRLVSAPAGGRPAGPAGWW